jgi:hypothetical protein
MSFHEYHPLLIAALRRTLARIEADFGGSDDNALTEVKSTIIRALGEHEVKAESLTAEQLGNPKVVVLVLPTESVPKRSKKAS